MIFIFDGFADGQINKISKDGGYHAWGRSCLLYLEHLVIASISYRCTIHSCTMPVLLTCPVLSPITWHCRIFSFILWSGLWYVRGLAICLLLVCLWVLQDVTALIFWVLTYFPTELSSRTFETVPYLNEKTKSLLGVFHKSKEMFQGDASRSFFIEMTLIWHSNRPIKISIKFLIAFWNFPASLLRLYNKALTRELFVPYSDLSFWLLTHSIWPERQSSVVRLVCKSIILFQSWGNVIFSVTVFCSSYQAQFHT